MSRARNIKPGFFKNDVLAECQPLARLLFAGLWCEADRAGRLEDRPARIKVGCLPYDDCNVDALLDELANHGFITRYRFENAKYIQILAFDKHQNPHKREPASSIPAPDEHGASTVQEQDKHGTGPADSPSLIPDSPFQREQPRATANRGTRLPADWSPSEAETLWAKQERPSIDIALEASKFADYWHGVAGSKGVKLDWSGTWRNWIRRADSPRCVGGAPITAGTPRKRRELGK